ncbi:hypothetical protein ACWDFR_38295 [Streptomyces sp. 900105755]
MALIRRLDGIFMDQSLLLRPGGRTDLDPAPLLRLAEEFDRLGDLAQAERARGLHASLR